jgi:hypothetical protein
MLLHRNHCVYSQTMMTMDPSHNYERKMFTQVNKRNIFSQVSQIDLASNYIDHYYLYRNALSKGHISRSNSV